MNKSRMMQLVFSLHMLNQKRCSKNRNVNRWVDKIIIKVSFRSSSGVKKTFTTILPDDIYETTRKFWSIRKRKRHLTLLEGRRCKRSAHFLALLRAWSPVCGAGVSCPTTAGCHENLSQKRRIHEHLQTRVNNCAGKNLITVLAGHAALTRRLWRFSTPLGATMGGGMGVGVKGGWRVNVFLFLLTASQAVLLPWAPLILHATGMGARSKYGRCGWMSVCRSYSQNWGSSILITWAENRTALLIQITVQMIIFMIIVIIMKISIMLWYWQW